MRYALREFWGKPAPWKGSPTGPWNSEDDKTLKFVVDGLKTSLSGHVSDDPEEFVDVILDQMHDSHLVPKEFGVKFQKLPHDVRTKKIRSLQ